MATTTVFSNSYFRPQGTRPLTQPTTKYLDSERLFALLGDFAASALGGVAGEIISAASGRSVDPLAEFFSFYDRYQSDPSGFSEEDYALISIEQLTCAFKGMAELIKLSRLDVEPIPSVYPEGNISATWHLGKSYNLSIEFYADQSAVCVLRKGSEFESFEWNIDEDVPASLREFLQSR